MRHMGVVLVALAMVAVVACGKTKPEKPPQKTPVVVDQTTPQAVLTSVVKLFENDELERLSELIHPSALALNLAKTGCLAEYV